MLGRIGGGMFAALILAVCGLGPAAAAPGSPADTTVTTVLLVRHAEKNAHAPGGDAGLSMKGMQRARELARALRDAGVDAVYASQFPRARLTAEPLARALADSVRVYDANDLEALAARIRSGHRGQTVLVVGHSDTVAQTIECLTGQRLPEDEAVAYDKLYLLILGPGGANRLLRLRYGAPAE